MGNLVLSLEDVHKSYAGQPVLKGVSLKLESGRFYALLGQNGAGKSTLMRVMMRHEPWDRGAGRVFDLPLDRDIGAKVNARIAYVSESVVYNAGPLGRFFEAYGRLYPKWDRAVFDRLLAEMGVSQQKGHAELSRGQKMQVVLAAALAQRPELILLDEITSVLDASARRRFLTLLDDFVKDGGTVVLATNIVSEVHHHADRIVILDGGRVTLEASPGELGALFAKLRRPKGAVHELFDRPDCVEVGVNPDGSIAHILPRALVAAPEALGELADSAAVTPEEAFVYFSRRKAA